MTDQPADDSHHVVEGLLLDGFLAGVATRLGRAYPDARADVEDAVAEAVIRFLAKAGKGELIEKPRDWIFVVAKNDVLRRLQRIKNREVTYEPDEDEQTGGPDEEALADDTYKFIVGLVERWPSARLRVVTLLFLESAHLNSPLSYYEAADEASAILDEDVPCKSIGKTKTRGLERLAAELHELWRHSDGAPDTYEGPS